MREKLIEILNNLINCKTRDEVCHCTSLIDCCPDGGCDGCPFDDIDSLKELVAELEDENT